ncbi:ficolin-3-like [Anopheles merus]|uniref:ficolin-3-like n=1 Tax=Anopheles merus TaxID=30066 RepID=UPI001BE42C68|nr:ficolin-3-like [Anopheles merus]
MNVLKVIIPVMWVLLTSTVQGDDHHNATDRFLPGFAYEMIANKLEYLQHKLHEMESTINEDRKFFARQIQSNMALIEAAYANHVKLREEIQLLASKKDLARFVTISGVDLQSISFESCKEILSKRSRKYQLQLSKNDKPFPVYCEQTAFGGGWLVFQYRYDGSVDFFRNWAEYRHGFGSMDGEFWLGLERLHQLTSARKYELVVELKDFDGNYKYARYNEFMIGSEAEQYPLAKLGSYTGTAGDSLIGHKGHKFSTKDRDNDFGGGNCAAYWEGAWWYDKCFSSTLNGLRKNNVSEGTMLWGGYKPKSGLAYSRMMIRET